MCVCCPVGWKSGGEGGGMVGEGGAKLEEGEGEEEGDNQTSRS